MSRQAGRYELEVVAILYTHPVGSTRYENGANGGRGERPHAGAAPQGHQDGQERGEPSLHRTG